MFTVSLNILESKEIASGMVENTIENHTDTFFVTGCHKCGKVFVGSQTGIQLFVIGCLVAMSYAFK